MSEGSKSSTHYLGDKNRFDVLSKGPSSGINSATYTGHVLKFVTIINKSFVVSTFDVCFLKRFYQLQFDWSIVQAPSNRVFIATA